MGHSAMSIARLVDGQFKKQPTHDPDDYRHNRVLDVEVGDGAVMSVPFGYWLWRLRYAKDTTPPPICDDRMMAAGVLDSYLALVTGYTKEETWRRIKLLRAALAANPEPED